MLELFSAKVCNCEGISRRSFLQVGSLGWVGLTLPAFLKARQASAAESTGQSDVNCILIWLHGGASHHDTFDPKPEAPVSVRGEFRAIDTAIPGVKFTEIVPQLAKEAKRFAVLRGWNPQNASHGLADQWVMSGRAFNPGIAYPTFGSVVSHYKGFKTVLPPFVQLGNSIDHNFGGGTAGILGLEHNPFEVTAEPHQPQFSVRDITPPAGIGSDRIDRRRETLARIDALQRAADIQPAAYDALDDHYKTALAMITSPATKKAFDIAAEDPKRRERFGNTEFGQRCLLARRLIEAGVRFVTIANSGWDTHQDNFSALKNGRLPQIDQGLPALLADLDEHGLLETTLVCVLTDFGRTPVINSASGRDHWGTAGFALMAGAGVPGGTVLGETDGEGARVIRNEYFSEDIAATVYAKLGLPLDLIAHAPDGRPVRLIEGRVIREWM